MTSRSTCESIESRSLCSSLTRLTACLRSCSSVTSILQKIANLPALPVARRLSTTRAPPTPPRTQVLALLKPLFDLDHFEPETRTRLRTALLNLLLPHLDAERRYDLKEHRLGAALARELGLDADVLGRWDAGEAWGGQYAQREIPVCLGEVVGRDWGRWCRSVSSVQPPTRLLNAVRRTDDSLLSSAQSRKGTSLTLLQVNDLLDELAAHSSWSSSYIRGASS